MFFAPNFLGDPNNFIPANPLQTPADIVPEWYFLPYYAILRSVPNKLLGVCMMFGSLLVLFVLPWLDTSPVRSARFRPIYRQLIWRLGRRGDRSWASAARTSRRASGSSSAGSRTLYYFLHFLVILPILGKLERPLPLPESISQPVLGATRRRTAARRRRGQADGESVMRPLRSLLAGVSSRSAWLRRASALRRFCRTRAMAQEEPTAASRNGASSACSAPSTSRPRSAGSRSIPMSAPTAIRCSTCTIATCRASAWTPSRSRRSPPASRCRLGWTTRAIRRTARRRRPASSIAVPEREGGPRRQQRRPAAGPVADRQRA